MSLQTEIWPHACFFFSLLLLFCTTLSAKLHCSLFQGSLSVHKGSSDNARRPNAAPFYRSCQSCDAWRLYNITGVTAHSQDDQGEWMKVGHRAPDESWTSVGMKTGEVKPHFDRHLCSAIMFEKELVKGPAHCSVELLLRNLKEQLKWTKRVSYHFSLGYASKASKDVFINAEWIHAKSLFSVKNFRGDWETRSVGDLL